MGVHSSSSVRRLPGRLGLLVRAAVLAVPLFLLPSLQYTGDAMATDCSAIQGKTPQQAPSIECPSPPCGANGTSATSACTCYDGNCTNCGALTTCVLLGSDPPISQTQWQREILAAPASARNPSGYCSPSPTGKINCPTTNKSLLR